MLHRAAAFAAAITAFSASATATVLPPPSLPHLPDGQWMRGDLHVHDDHSSDGSGPRQALSQAAPGNNAVTDQIDFAFGQGLQFLPLTDHRTYDQHYDPLWESSNLLLIRGEEANGSPHALAHGAVDTIVQGANPAGAPGFVNLQQSIWEAHAQDANWITAHPDDGETNDDGSPNVRASAVGVDLIEVWNRSSDIDKEMAYAEGRWNAGFRTGISGASDDHFIEVWPVAGPGMPTTLVYAQPRERAVIDGLRSGHTTIASDGSAPLLTLAADLNFDGVADALGGDELVLPANTRVQLIITIERPAGATINLYQAPGKAAGAAPVEVISTRPLAQTRQVFYRTIITGSTPTWFRAEARGPGTPSHYDIGNLPLSIVPSPQQLPDELRAITAPLFFSTAPTEAHGEIPVPADAGTSDGATLMLGDPGVFSGFPDAATSNGITHVVAERHDGGRSQITYRRRSGGVLGATVTLTPNAQSARFPKVAARGNDVWIAYQDEPGSEVPHRSTIVLRHSADGGVTWSGEQTLRAVAGRCEHPALAIGNDGRPVVAWQEISARHPFDVMAQVVGLEGAPLNVSWDNDNPKNVLPAVGDSRSARYPASVWPSLAVAADGRIGIAWQDDRTDPDPLWTGSTGVGDGTDPDNWQIMVRVRAPNATAWGRSATLGAVDRADRHPSIAFAANGALIATWSSKTLNSSGVNEAVLSSRTTNGVDWSAPAAIAPNGNAQSIWPKLARGTDGRVRATWHDSRSADWRWRVMTAKQDLSGVWGAAQLIPSRGINTWPALGGSTLVFASTRNAQRLQRDRTQQIFAIDLP